MRTLDEVIKAVGEDLECANVSYPEVFYDYDNHKDALHYLKEYKIKRERIMAKAQDCEDAEKRLQNEIAVYKEILTDYVALKQYWAEQQENNPLTWDELKAMEGKTVWIEEHGGGEWYVIGHTYPIFNQQSKPTDESILLGGVYNIRRARHNLGTKWRAYRKERHELDQKAH